MAILKRIANSPVHRRIYHQHEKNEKRKQKRRERTKKYQSRFWDDETKEKIRAERAAKKLLNTEDPVSLSSESNVKVGLAEQWAESP